VSNTPTKDDYMAVAHVERDETGTKVEPEQQPAQVRGSIPVVVNLGVANPDGGAPIITKADLAHGISANYTRDTTAGELAEEQITRCTLCRFFDRDKLQRTAKSEAMRVDVAQNLIALGYTNSPQRAAVLARAVGWCSVHAAIAHPEAHCAQFKPRRFAAEVKAANAKREQILKGAQGKLGKE
jgi:hypothetical protein